MADEIRTVENNFETKPYDVTKNIVVQPTTTSEQTSVGAPDPATMQYIQENIIKPTQKAYGINPDTGEVTPFQALGYNPEDERKRRAAEMALNDRKRKENAWYNAFAVVGDSLTAALGGNVWQRQPNRIGQQAIADNARLQAEQKAEDEANAAKIRDAGAAYANTVNNLIKNYLTKTKTTTRTGGNKTETEHHAAQTGYRQQSFKIGDGNDGGTSGGGAGGGSRGMKIIKLAKKDPNTGEITGYTSMTVPAAEADAYSRLVQTTLQKKFEEGELNDELSALEKAGIYNPTATDPTNRWNADKILTYGRSFYTDALKSEIDKLWAMSKEYNGEGIKWTDYNGKKPTQWQGVEPEEYDD